MEMGIGTFLLDNNNKRLFCEQVLPKLGWNDLLRFRRVSKTAKQVVDEYIKENGLKMCPQITIYEAGQNKEKTLGRFLQLGFPTSRIHLVNISGGGMFEKESSNFTKFLKEYGPNVTEVKVHKLSNHPTGTEKKFYEGLSKLETLNADKFGSVATTEQEALLGALRLDESGKTLPKTFKELKKLTIGAEPNVISMNLIIASRTVMDFCGNLEYAADAFSSGIKLNVRELYMETLGFMFGLIQQEIENRAGKAPNKPNLKFYDFASFNLDKLVQDKGVGWISAAIFTDLANACVKNSVKLLNVNAAWLQRSNAELVSPTHAVHFQYGPLEFGDLVISMVNMHGKVVGLEMKNLEKLTIMGTSQCCLFPGIWKRDRKLWPSLKTLEVTVDSKMLYTMVVDINKQTEKATCLDPETTTSLMQCLFVGIRRPALVDVSLKFEEGVDVEDDTLKAVCSVGSCCPNLKKLALSNWSGSNMTLVKMWGQMKSLEELSLEKCKLIGNLAFMKTDTTDGISSTLTHLKKISLLGLDKMPKITDSLFKDVLSQMELSHLVLSSDKPLSNVTSEGILSLKNGIFAQSIERFPFEGWSLAKQSKEDFRRLEKEFRSYNMI